MSAKEGLPSEGREREIFLRALQKFSDECEPPELQADCPFSIPLPGGGRGCGEECMDLLAQYGDHTVIGVDLGNGLVAQVRHRRPPRPRRGPDAATQPFDARATMLRDRDSGRPVSAWNSISLVNALHEQLSTTPVGASAKREGLIRECWEELERRGYEVDALVRQGMAKWFMTAIAISTVLPELVQLDGEDASGQVAEIFRPAPPEWGTLLDHMIEETGDVPAEDMQAVSPKYRRILARLVSALTGTFMQVARAWLQTASLEELIAWRAPRNPEETLLLADVDGAPAHDNAIYEWMVDRFVTTYLTDWSEESLHYEWRYVHAQISPPCPGREMAHRRIAAADLACEISNRAVKARQQDSASKSTSLSTREMASTAIEFLGAGRRAEAAALFEAAKRVNPQDPEVVNNYGFCVLADRPEEGLREIERAGGLGYRHRSITLANRMYGLFRIGRLTSALDAAERFLAEGEEDEQAYLWDWRRAPEDPAAFWVSARRYIVQLGLHIAELTGDETQVKVWAERAAAVE